MKPKPKISVEQLCHNGLWIARTTGRKDIEVYIGLTREKAMRGIRKLIKKGAV